MSSSSTEVCHCDKAKANLNNVNWQRHIKTCSVKKIKTKNKSIKSFFSPKPIDIINNDSEFNGKYYNL